MRATQFWRLWNQKGAYSGSFLVARMAASYINLALGRLCLIPANGSGPWSCR
jgi:hypothetical protein